MRAKEFLSEEQHYIGNCAQDDVVDDLFGDINNFAWYVENYGDEFEIDGVKVTYDPDSDVHSFYLAEHRMVWKRNPRTGQVKMAWRCETGPRKNKTVPNVLDCSKPLNVAQAQRTKATRAKTKVRQARKAKKTKRVNPASRLARSLNKRVRKE